MTSPAWPVTLAAIPGFTALALVLSDGPVRRLLAGWTATAAILFLNPLIAPPLMEVLVPPNIYWRLFYIVPFPLVCGIVFLCLTQRVERAPRRTRVIVWALVVLGLLAGHLPDSSRSALRRVRFGAPAPRLEPALLHVARQVAAVAPDGPMLAPPEVGGAVSIIRAGVPQIVTAYEAVGLTWFSSIARLDELEERQEAACFIEGDAVVEWYRKPDSSPCTFRAFAALLRREPVRTIVLHSDLLRQPKVRALLAELDYSQMHSAGPYTVVWTTTEPPHVPGGHARAQDGGALAPRSKRQQPPREASSPPRRFSRRDAH